MSAMMNRNKKSARERPPHTNRNVLAIAALGGAMVFLSTPILADESVAAPGSQQQQGAVMPSVKEQAGEAERQSPAKTGSMNMGSMQGSTAPPAMRDPNGYSDGYEYTGMPGMEKADQIIFSKLLFDQLEFTRNGNRTGVAWDAYVWYGSDKQKLLLRSEGDVIGGVADQTTSAEGLWWRPFKPFWATVLGMRQDFGPGSRTHLAFGVQGLAPYWFDLEATGYVDYDGTFSARLKGSYDVRLTNRLILTPEVESNLYSKANLRRALGSGVANIETQARLRYEFSRKFAPYIGFDWDRALGDSARLNRPGGKAVSDLRFVAGARMWR